MPKANFTKRYLTQFHVLVYSGIAVKLHLNVASSLKREKIKKKNEITNICYYSTHSSV
jgi:hypothetical protein